MKKIWYINLDGENIGPLTGSEVGQMLNSGEINKFTMVWKAQLKEWEPIFKHVGEFEPDLPDLPVSDDELPELPSLPNEMGHEDDPLPAIPLEVQEELEGVDTPLIDSDLSCEPEFNNEILDEAPSLFEQEVELDSQSDLSPEADESEYREDNDQEIYSESGEERSFPIASTAVAGFIVAVIVVVTMIKVGNLPDYKMAYENISAAVLQKLSKKIDSSKFYVNLGVDKNSNVVFGRSNLKTNAKYEAEFEFIPDGIQKDEVSFRSSAISKKGQLKFDEFYFEKGNKILQGKYRVKVKAVVDDTYTRLKNLLLGRAVEYRYSEDVMLIPGTEKEYQQSLSKIQTNLKSVEKELLLSLDQKVQTIESLLTSMALHFRVAMKKTHGRSGAKDFKSRYTSSAGPLLQSIILDDYEGLIKKTKQKATIQDVGNRIHILAKSVSSWSVDLSSSLEREGRLNTRKRRKLKKGMEESLKLLLNRVNNLRDDILEKSKKL